MLHRGIKFAYVVAMIASAALAFIVLRNYDEFATSGYTYSISLDRSDDGAGATAVAKAVEDFTKASHTNVGRLYYDPLDGSRRQIYLATGDPAAESAGWVARGYPYFSRDTKVDLHPYSDIASVEPDGVYLIYGTAADAQNLMSVLQGLGYEGTLEPAFSVATFVQTYSGGPILSCFLIVCLVVVVSVASAVALNAKSYGVQRLQGEALQQILFRDLKQLGLFCAVAVTLIGIAATGLLYWYNRLHQFSTFALVVTAVASVFVVLGIGSHVAALALLHRSSILEAVKGEVNANWAVVGSYVLRCWGILLILSIGTSTIAAGLTLRDQREEYKAWTSLGSAYYLRINGAIEYVKAGRSVSEKMGQWVRAAGERNEISLASRQVTDSGKEFLVVDNGYLAAHDIYEASGATVQSPAGNEVRILVPQRRSAETAQIKDDIQSWMTPLTKRAGGVTPEIVVGASRDHQVLMSYARGAASGGMTVEDPVVVVVTGKAAVFSNDEYVSMASRGEILISDPKRAMSELTAAGVGSYILGLSPFAQDAAENLRDAKRNFSVAVFNLLAGVAVLLVTAVSVSVIYCRKNAQALFVKYIHGWGFVQTTWKILMTELVLGVLAVLWVWYQSYSVIQAHNVPGAPPLLPDQLPLGGREPLVAGVVALISLVLVVYVLKRTNVKFVQSHSATLS